MQQHLYIRILCLSFLFLQCQPKISMSTVNADMSQNDYTSAIEKLKKMERKGTPEDKEVSLKLAECYRLTQQYDKAESYYAQIVKMLDAQPIHFLYYGQMLQINDKSDLAKEWYQKFVDLVPDDVRGQYLLKSIDAKQELLTKNLGVYAVQKALFNTAKDENQPTLNGSQILYSVQVGNTGINSFLFTNGTSIYEAANGTTTAQNAKVFLNLKTINIGGDNCTVLALSNLTVVGNKVFFSAKQSCSFIKKGGVQIHNWKIFTADWVNGAMLNIMSLPFNSDEFNALMPSLSTDGSQIYFSSDMPGGFGGLDLYVSKKEMGKWGPAMNLGPNINTEGNEISSFITSPEGLYFASNGHLGLGGFDILYASDTGRGQWSSPVNLGAPINSVSDDFGFNSSKDKTKGIFSSNRKGGAGFNDIYSFTHSLK
jgi:Tetratricopeptide repeat/WD40-like Beta Propeller Repeat